MKEGGREGGTEESREGRAEAGRQGGAEGGRTGEGDRGKWRGSSISPTYRETEAFYFRQI